MGIASGIRAGAAYIELALSDSKFIKGLRWAMAKLKAFGVGLKDIGGGMKDFGKNLAMVGGGLIAPLLASVKTFAETGDALDEMSQRTGISVEALSELGYAADFSGASLADVGTGVKFMQKSFVAAVNGSEKAAEAFGALGLTVQKLQGLSPDEQFALIGERLNQIQSPAQRAALAMEIFGRSGVNLLPMIEDLPRLREEARKLGLTMSTEDAKAAASLQDAMQRLWKVIKKLSMTVGAALAPLIKEWAQKAQDAVIFAKNWVSQNRGLVQSLLQIGVVLVGAGAALVVLGTALAWAGQIIMGVVAFLSMIGAAITGIISIAGGLIGGVVAAFSAIATVIGAIFTPLGLLITGLIAVGVWAGWASGVFQKAWNWAATQFGKIIQWLGARFDELKAIALEAFGGIRDALAAGDLALAGRVAWLGLNAAWQTGINALKGLWLDFKKWFVTGVSDVFFGAVVVAANAWAWLQSAWTKTISFLEEQLRHFTGFFKSAWIDMAGAAAKTWAWMKSLVTDIDIQAEFRRIDQESAREKEASLDEGNRNLQRKRSNLADIEKERAGTLAALADMANADERARKEGWDADRKASEDALAAAKEELRLAVQEAKTKRQAAELDQQAAPEPPKPPRRDEVIRQTKAAFEAIGTFSAAQAADFGSASLSKSQLEESRKQTAHLDAIEDHLEDLNLGVT